jgi:hypothetical protein
MAKPRRRRVERGENQKAWLSSQSQALLCDKRCQWPVMASAPVALVPALLAQATELSVLLVP